MAIKIRDILAQILPSWLAESSALLTVASMVDHGVESMLQGSLAAAGRGTPTALKYLQQETGVTRGRLDTDASYAAKLPTWIERHKERGNARRLARELHEYLGGSRVRVINRAGRWVTCATDGTVTEREGPWNWDGVSHPERNTPAAPWWSDLWIVIYSPYPIRPGTLGAVVPDTFAIGHMVPLAEADVLRLIFHSWKAAHECVRAVIWTTDNALFDPDVPASLPDGTWGAWSTRGSGSRVASGRFTSSRYWEPR